MPAPIDLVGQVFGRLTVLELVSPVGAQRRWLCQCECGNQTEALGGNIKRGDIRSCGCIVREKLAERNTKHGMSGTPSYSVWLNMLDRCYRTANEAYPRYGGSGIVVCDRWRNSFDNFYADMGSKPDGMSLDRFPNGAGNYEPENCRWATPGQQAENRKSTIWLTYAGKTQTATAWAKELGVSLSAITKRYHAGWSAEDIIQRMETITEVTVFTEEKTHG